MIPPAAPDAAPAAPTTPASGTPDPAAAAAPATPPASLIGPDGSLNKDWALSFGDEYAPLNEQANKFTSIGGLLESYHHARSTQIQYPGQDATPEQITAYRQASHVPDEPSIEAYGLTRPADLPDTVPWDDELGAAVAKAAHQAHGSPAVVKAIADTYNQYMLKAMEGMQAEQAKADEAKKSQLIEQWGADFQAHSSTARHTLATFAAQAGLDPDSPGLKGLANNPEALLILHSVSKHIGEDNIRTPHGYGDLRSDQQRADAIMDGTDPEWGPKYKTGDLAAMQLVSKLLDKAKQ